MYNMPFWGYPYYKNHYPRPYPRVNNKPQEIEEKSTTSEITSSTKTESRHNNDSQAFINILGIDLYSDDILILCILLSLYLEGVKDEMLFICLILLLLS